MRASEMLLKRLAGRRDLDEDPQVFFQAILEEVIEDDLEEELEEDPPEGANAHDDEDDY